MIIAGPNLYRVTYKISGLQKIKEVEFQRLVVAYSEKEAAAHVGSTITMIQPLENDISLCVPDHYIRSSKLNEGNQQQ